MNIGDIRLIDHPRGREAMIGWMVRVKEGIGTIRRFFLEAPSKGKLPGWYIAVEFSYPQEMLGKHLGYQPEEVVVLGIGETPEASHPVPDPELK